MCKKNNFQIFLLFAIEMEVLSVFLKKKGLGPLGVKFSLFHILYLWTFRGISYEFLMSKFYMVYGMKHLNSLGITCEH